MLVIHQPGAGFLFAKCFFGNAAVHGGQLVYLLIEGIVSVQDTLRTLGYAVMYLVFAPVNFLRVDNIFAQHTAVFSRGALGRGDLLMRQAIDQEARQRCSDVA